MKRYYIGAAVVVTILGAGIWFEERGGDLAGVALGLTIAALLVCVLVAGSYAARLRFERTPYGRQTFAGYLTVIGLLLTSLLRQLRWEDVNALTAVVMGLVLVLGALREAMILRRHKG